MSTASQGRSAIKKIIFGDTLLPQEFSLGLPDPQTEIEVWLHGIEEPLDVTYRHTMACADPFTICIRIDASPQIHGGKFERLSLKFSERGGQTRVLAEIGLKLIRTLPATNSD